MRDINVAMVRYVVEQRANVFEHFTDNERISHADEVVNRIRVSVFRPLCGADRIG